MAIPTNTDTSNGRLPRSSSASSIRASDDSHDRPPSGRSTPKLARPRSRRHSRSAVTPVDSPTAQRSPERDPNAIASAFSTTQPVKTQDITTVEDFD
uniref:Uncharacterized protein n=1 Tax=Plectus sambesii TaxID=2011161 RepID=A0A914XES8_9BILA